MLRCADGLQFLAEAAAEGRSFDVLIVDVADTSAGGAQAAETEGCLTAPPPAFLSSSAVQAACQCLRCASPAVCNPPVGSVSRASSNLAPLGDIIPAPTRCAPMLRMPPMKLDLGLLGITQSHETLKPHQCEVPLVNALAVIPSDARCIFAAREGLLPSTPSVQQRQWQQLHPVCPSTWPKCTCCGCLRPASFLGAS